MVRTSLLLMWYFATIQLHNNNNNSIKDKPPLTCKTCCRPSLLICNDDWQWSWFTSLPYWRRGITEQQQLTSTTAAVAITVILPQHHQCRHPDILGASATIVVISSWVPSIQMNKPSMFWLTTHSSHILASPMTTATRR
jgi:hypothetical protein